jgi:hypothetical protein
MPLSDVTCGGGLEIVPVAPLAQKKSGEIRTRSPTENLVLTKLLPLLAAQSTTVPIPVPVKSAYRHVGFA